MRKRAASLGLALVAGALIAGACSGRSRSEIEKNPSAGSAGEAGNGGRGGMDSGPDAPETGPETGPDGTPCPRPCTTHTECAPFGTLCTERDGEFGCGPCPELSGIVCVLEYCLEMFPPATRDGGQVGGGCDPESGQCYCQIEWSEGAVTPIETHPEPVCP